MIVDDRIGSRVEEMLYDYKNGLVYTGIAMSRVEKQLMYRFFNVPYDGPVVSRVEKFIMSDTPLELIISRIERIIDEKDEYPGPWLSRIERLLKGLHGGDSEYLTYPLQASTGEYIQTSTGEYIYVRIKKEV